MHTPGGWQIQEHLPLSSTQGAKLTDGALTLWREQGGNRYDKHHARHKTRGHDSNVMRILK